MSGSKSVRNFESFSARKFAQELIPTTLHAVWLPEKAAHIWVPQQDEIIEDVESPFSGEPEFVRLVGKTGESILNISPWYVRSSEMFRRAKSRVPLGLADAKHLLANVEKIQKVWKSTLIFAGTRVRYNFQGGSGRYDFVPTLTMNYQKDAWEFKWSRCDEDCLFGGERDLLACRT